jgi:hypothetical protein
MATCGKTWWGKKWLETFNGIDCDNKLYHAEEPMLILERI